MVFYYKFENKEYLQFNVLHQRIANKILVCLIPRNIFVNEINFFVLNVTPETFKFNFVFNFGQHNLFHSHWYFVYHQSTRHYPDSISSLVSIKSVHVCMSIKLYALSKKKSTKQTSRKTNSYTSIDFHETKKIISLFIFISSFCQKYINAL